MNKKELNLEETQKVIEKFTKRINELASQNFKLDEEKTRLERENYRLNNLVDSLRFDLSVEQGATQRLKTDKEKLEKDNRKLDFSVRQLGRQRHEMYVELEKVNESLKQINRCLDD